MKLLTDLSKISFDTLGAIILTSLRDGDISFIEKGSVLESNTFFL